MRAWSCSSRRASAKSASDIFACVDMKPSSEGIGARVPLLAGAFAPLLFGGAVRAQGDAALPGERDEGAPLAGIPPDEGAPAGGGTTRAPLEETGEGDAPEAPSFEPC